MTGSRRCPCGRGEVFDECCAPLLDGTRAAATAAALMRSRYTAFATGDREYLVRSWHSSTRPAELDLDADLRWMFLEIVRTERGGPFDETGTVEFIAHYRAGRERGAMHEVSRFVRENGDWVYLDGVVQN